MRAGCANWRRRTWARTEPVPGGAWDGSGSRGGSRDAAYSQPLRLAASQGAAAVTARTSGHRLPPLKV